ncbi:hypothetical protein HELRODRAFT_166816 [Helobdella robusta]|uniref:Uncharacterized protein n=1 Tax=Helobdella robusta TaxID=6412 RepID=T1EYK1_HELRO|nr:hypothetical protein HELRODRAFT_166816 [Helobdella robusta]ESO11774.1 hypothetical protein HELRODRAFT_166816 [Helobdella robusta]
MHTALHIGAQLGHQDILKLLVSHGSDLNAQSTNYLTPLHLCSREGNLMVAEILLTSGAIKDASSKGCPHRISKGSFTCERAKRSEIDIKEITRKGACTVSGCIKAKSGEVILEKEKGLERWTN